LHGTKVAAEGEDVRLSMKSGERREREERKEEAQYVDEKPSLNGYGLVRAHFAS